MTMNSFDQLAVGDTETHGPYIVPADEMLAFNRRWDPLPIHVEAAHPSPHGGIIASSIYTLAVKQRLLGMAAWPREVIGAVGHDEMRFAHPVRAGDALRLTWELLEKRPSRSKPDRGILKFRMRLENQHDEIVLSLIDTVLIARKGNAHAQSVRTTSHATAPASDSLAIPAVWMRGGTSKGLFFHRRDLPVNTAERDRILLAALGSPDPYGKQMDGVGGATSSTSKAAIIAPSTQPGCDIDFLFAHIAVERPVIDYSGTCGNLSAAVGVFALEQGLVAPGAGEACLVRVWQANLQQRFNVRVPMTEAGSVRTAGDYAIAGVAGTAAPIAVEFLNPVPADAGGVLPTGKAIDALEIEGLGTIEVSLVNAGNPCVFVRPEALGLSGDELPASVNAMPAVLVRAELIRTHATVRMGLAPTLAAAALRPATPKIALVSPPRAYTTTGGMRLDETQMDICVRIFSMGQLHHAVTGTGAIAVGVAARIPCTLVQRSARRPAGSGLRIGHCAGTMEVDAVVQAAGGGYSVPQVTIYRTARTLMRGEVLVPCRGSGYPTAQR